MKRTVWILMAIVAIFLGVGPECGSEVARNERDDQRDLGQWRTAASMNQARYGLGLVQLHDGRVLTCGGSVNTSRDLASCEIYDPTDDRWRPAASMHRARSYHEMTILDNGQVLAVGGTYGEYKSTTSAERYDPRTDAWIRLPDTPGPVYLSPVVPLPASDAMVAGGTIYGNAAYDHVFVFRSAVQGWQRAPSLREGRSHHCAARVGGETLVFGGGGSYRRCWPSKWLCLWGGKKPVLRSAERYDRERQRWRRAPRLPVNLRHCSSIALDQDRLLARSDATVLLYEAKPRKWHRVPAPPCQDSPGHAWAPLADGRAILAGGFHCPEVPEPGASAVFSPATRTWSWGPPIQHDRDHPQALLLDDGRVLLVGGMGPGGAASAAVEILESK